MKRSTKVIIAIVLIACITWLSFSVLTSGCSTLTHIMKGSPIDDIFDACHADVFGAGDQIYSTVEIALPSHSAYTALGDKSAYASLTTDYQRQAYRSIEESIFRVTYDGGGSHGRYQLSRAKIPALTSAEIFMVKEAVLSDHPEVFWVTGNYTLGSNMRDGNYIVLYSYYSYDDIITRARTLEQKIAEALRSIPGGLSEFDRELAVHDYIVNNTEYDSDSVEFVDSFTDASTSYGVFVNRKALCSGYSYAAKLLLNRVGIPCSVIKGVSKGTGHMWNIVCIDGLWYHLDVTWDDPISITAEPVCSYDYFNLTDEFISHDHEIAGGYELLTSEVIASQDENSSNFYNFPREKCIWDKANFYTVFATSINELNSDYKSLIARQMKECSLSGDTALYYRFPETMDNAVIENWLDSALSSAMASSNKDARTDGGLRILRCSRVVRSEDSPQHWSKVYCVSLIFDSK
ncbi:MAG: hypothetical protein E7546_06225 [Ruminococcaceae bacterium]|nr:hypothetical protein [Oscillospiraceae bacterium]